MRSGQPPDCTPHDAQPRIRCASQSSWLRDALSEFDPSSEKLTIICNPPPPGNRAPRTAPPCLRLRAVGQFGTTELDYPNDREVIETCECPQTVAFTYVPCLARGTGSRSR